MSDIREILQEIDRQYGLLDSAAMEQYLKKIILDFEEENGKKTIGCASLFNELGSFYRTRSRYAEGEQAFLKAAGILAEVAGTRSFEYATTVNNLAELYRLWGRREDAERCLRESLEIFRETAGERSLLYASNLNYLGNLYLDGKEYDKALTVYSQALDIVSQLPDNLAYLATAYSNISTPLSALGRHGEALDHLLKSIDLYENTLGTEDYHYNAALNSIGFVSYVQGDYEKALFYYRKTKEIAEKKFGSVNKEYAIAAKNCAICLEKMGQLCQAAEAAAEARDSYFGIYGAENQYTKSAEQYCRHLKSREK